MDVVLIDSHIFIWALFEKNRLGKAAQRTLLEAAEVKVSTASLWELALKYRKGKLVYSPDLLIEGVAALGASWLETTPEHILQSSKITIKHPDPFDQMLMSQAIFENIPLLTSDEEIVDIKFPGLRLIDGRE